MKELNALRSEIDRINSDIIKLYLERLEVSREIAEYKRANSLPVYDSKREEALLLKVSEEAGEAYAPGVRELFTLLMRLSREEQERENGGRA